MQQVGGFSFQWYCFTSIAALWDAFGVIFVSSAQSYLVSFVSDPVRKSVFSVDGDVGGVYVIIYGWC